AVWRRARASRLPQRQCVLPGRPDVDRRLEPRACRQPVDRRSAWAPCLHLEGGPPPWKLVPDSAGLSSLIAGFFAARVGLPAPKTAPTVREFQRRQLEVALPWAARELGLDPPRLPS